MKRGILTAAAGVAASALVLSACTPPGDGGNGGNGGDGGNGGGGEVSVMWNQPFYSMNNNTSATNNVTNANVVYMMNDAFKYYDENLKLQDNTSFGTVEQVSEDPLKVKYTYSDNAKWSDGTPVDAADLVLAWAARSGNFNTTEDAERDDEGVVEDAGGDVFFDAAEPGLALIKDFPEISEDGKEITFEYTKPFADWETNLTIGDSGVPAHIVAKNAIDTGDAEEGKKAILDAVENEDKEKLAKVAEFWNTGYNMTSMPEDEDLLIGTGPMKMTDFKEGQYLTLEARDDYEGDRKPQLSKITVRYNEDPMAAVQALENGEVQLINPQSTADVLQAVEAIDGVENNTADGATYEHVDLTFDNNGPFDPASYGGDEEKAKQVREAFLQSIPRGKIVNDIVKPLNDQAQIRNSFTQVPGSPDYDTIVQGSGIEDTYGEGDAEKAKQMLEEAGVDEAPKVRLLYAKGNARREQEFQLIKESAEKAGFEVIDNSSETWSEDLGNGEYDASLFGWQSTSTAVTESDANFRAGGQNNFGGFANDEVDKLYDELQTETDPARQAEILGEVEKILVDEGFGLTLFQFPEVVAYSDQLQNVKPMTVSPTMFWNFWEWEM